MIFTEAQVREIVSRLPVPPDRLDKLTDVMAEVYAEGGGGPSQEWRDAEDLRQLKDVHADALKEAGAEAFLGPVLYALCNKVKASVSFEVLDWWRSRGLDVPTARVLHAFIIAMDPKELLDEPDKPFEGEAVLKALGYIPDTRRET